MLLLHICGFPEVCVYAYDYAVSQMYFILVFTFPFHHSWIFSAATLRKLFTVFFYYLRFTI